MERVIRKKLETELTLELSDILLKSSYDMFEDCYNKKLIYSIENAVFGFIIGTLSYNLKNEMIKLTINNKLKEGSSEEENLSKLIEKILDHKGFEIKNRILEMSELRKKQGKPFKKELEKYLEEMRKN